MASKAQTQQWQDELNAYCDEVFEELEVEEVIDRKDGLELLKAGKIKEALETGTLTVADLADNLILEQKKLEDQKMRELIRKAQEAYGVDEHGRVVFPAKTVEVPSSHILVRDDIAIINGCVFELKDGRFIPKTSEHPFWEDGCEFDAIQDSLSLSSNPPIHIEHRVLNRKYKTSATASDCPICGFGSLVIHTEGVRGKFRAEDVCTSCGQHFVYTDIDTNSDTLKYVTPREVYVKGKSVAKPKVSRTALTSFIDGEEEEKTVNNSVREEEEKGKSFTKKFEREELKKILEKTYALQMTIEEALKSGNSETDEWQEDLNDRLRQLLSITFANIDENELSNNVRKLLTSVRKLEGTLLSSAEGSGTTSWRECYDSALEEVAEWSADHITNLRKNCRNAEEEAVLETYLTIRNLNRGK